MIKKLNISPAMWALIGTEKARFFWLVILSMGLALSEGLSVSLLIPILEADSTGSSAFAHVPVLKDMMAYINAIDPEMRLTVVTAVLAVAVLARGLTQFGTQALSAIIPLNVQCQVMDKVYGELVTADLAHAADFDGGEIRNLLREHPQRAASVVQSFASIIVSFFIIGLYGLLMLALSWQMTLAAMVFVIFGYLLMKGLSGPWFKWSGVKLSDALSRMHAMVNETLVGLVLIKLRNAEGLMRGRYGQGIEDLRHVEVRRNLFAELQNPVFMTATGLFICTLLILGTVVFGVEDKSWTGLFILFIVCLYRLMGPATRLVTSQAMISANLHAFDEIQAFLSRAQASRLPDGDVPFTHLDRAIGFDGVSVVYDEKRGPALDDVSFEINNREMIALVGPSGSGKSTLVSLVMRLRDPDGGRVTLDGRDLREFQVATWRARISAVSQDIVLFNDTVRANLTFGLQSVDDERVWNALKFAAADEFVRAMPNGLDEKLGEGGGALSGGQRQRLALARAILSEPDVLVLDEATSHLDTITEAAIQRTIQEVRAKHTVLIVAHRLSTIRHADRIVVMEAGRVAEIGSHDELFNKGGVYRRLFDSQQLELDMDEEAAQ